MQPERVVGALESFLKLAQLAAAHVVDLVVVAVCGVKILLLSVEIAALVVHPEQSLEIVLDALLVLGELVDEAE